MDSAAKKILIVEDNEDLIEIYRMSFEAVGFAVRSSPHGIDGIVQALDFHPDVILLDLMMPQMDGYEVLSAIRNNSSMQVTIIVCSNLSQQSDIDRALEFGADHYLRKSDYRPAALAEKVISLVPDSSATSHLVTETAQTFALPENITRYFDVLQTKSENGRVSLWLEEKNIPPTTEGKESILLGFLPPVTLAAIPYHDTTLVIHLQRHHWGTVDGNGSHSLARTLVADGESLVVQLESVPEEE